MHPTYYFDDPEQGLSRETSHPRFLELAGEDFYYDCGDDFSPLGNDAGADTLSFLEDWYRNGGQDSEAIQFLTDLLADWALGVPAHLTRANPNEIEAWLKEDDLHESFLLSECQARVATAFGQLKITGRVDSGILAEGLAAISCRLWINERARRIHPDWRFADENDARLRTMQAVLKRLQFGPE